MQTGKTMRFPPLSVEDFRTNYEIEGDDNKLIAEYTKYLSANKLQHHYGACDTLEIWLVEQIKDYVFNNQVQQAKKDLAKWIAKEYDPADVVNYENKDAMSYVVHVMKHEYASTMEDNDPVLVQMVFELEAIENLLLAVKPQG